MKRRLFFKGVSLFGLSSLFLTGAQARTVKKNMLYHHVFFWLKPEITSAEKKQLEKALATLGTIRTVKSIHIGKPAATADRDVVDHSYAYALLLGFDDVEGQNTYQEHPTHLAFVDQNKDLWTTVKVYDSQAIEV